MKLEPLVISKIEANGLKAFLSSFIGWAIPAVILLGALFIANHFVDFSIIFESLQFIGFDASVDTVMHYLVVIVVFLVFMVSFYNTINAVFKRIDMFPDKIIYSSGFGKSDISLANVVKVNYTNQGFGFGSGSVLIETTGTKKELVKVGYVSHPQERVVFLQSVIANYHYKIQKENNTRPNITQSPNSSNI